LEASQGGIEAVSSWVGGHPARLCHFLLLLCASGVILGWIFKRRVVFLMKWSVSRLFLCVVVLGVRLEYDVGSFQAWVLGRQSSGGRFG